MVTYYVDPTFVGKERNPKDSHFVAHDTTRSSERKKGKPTVMVGTEKCHIFVAKNGRTILKRFTPNGVETSVVKTEKKDTSFRNRTANKLAVYSGVTFHYSAEGRELSKKDAYILRKVNGLIK